MRILLDESVPRGLRQFLENHSVITVSERGWSSFSNGKLLELAASDFDVLVTADQNLPHQQNLVKFDLAVVVLVARSNRMVDYLSLKDKLLEAVDGSSSQSLQWVREIDPP